MFILIKFTIKNDCFHELESGFFLFRTVLPNSTK